MRTPVALFVFNRPEQTRLVLDRIIAAHPSRLFVVADAPRPGRDDRCAETLALFDRLDFPVEYLVATKNMGPGKRIASGLDWVFSHAPEAIIFEDDCVPDPTFFHFCEELLAKYRNDPRVWAISGNCFVPRPEPESYRFSQWLRAWGWAGWADRWRKHDQTMNQWPALRDSGWAKRRFQSAWLAQEWTRIWDKTFAGEVNTWDYQFAVSIMAADGLVATPNHNLVSNVGIIGSHEMDDRFMNLPTSPMAFPLRHPEVIRSTDDEHLNKAPDALVCYLTQAEVDELMPTNERFLERWLALQREFDSRGHDAATLRSKIDKFMVEVRAPMVETTKPKRARRGALFIVWGKLAEANNPTLLRATTSFALHHPELPQHVVRLDSANLLAKADMLDLSPFDETVFLDADTTTLGRLDYGFERAAQYGLAVSLGVHPLARQHQSAGFSMDAQQWSTGVVFATRKAQPVFDAWKRIAPTLDSSIRHVKNGQLCVMPFADQASFAKAIEETGFNPFVLSQNWNFAPPWDHSWFGQIKVWHSYGEVPPVVFALNRKYADPSVVMEWHHLG